VYFIAYGLAKITIKPIEENNKKLKEYNHNLAHEIKTPLAVVKSNLELLEL
jgi:signal transduction histidine kinase